MDRTQLAPGDADRIIVIRTGTACHQAIPVRATYQVWSWTVSFITSTACSTPSTVCCTTPVATRPTRSAIDLARLVTGFPCLLTRGLEVAALFRRVADFRRGADVVPVLDLLLAAELLLVADLLVAADLLLPLAAKLRFAADTPRFAAIRPRLAELFVAGPRLAALFLAGARLLVLLPALLLVEARFVALFFIILPFLTVLLRVDAPRVVADFAPLLRAADFRAGDLRALDFLPAVPAFLLPLFEPPRDDFLAAAIFQAPMI